MNDLNIDETRIAEKCNLPSEEDLYAALGSGDLPLTRVLHIIESIYGLDGAAVERPVRLKKSRHNASNNDIHIHGVGKLLTVMAKCCLPIPGDDVVGYITQGRGISVHRQDCINMAQHSIDEPERVIEVRWGEELDNMYPVNIQVEAYDRTGLLSDITSLLANEKVNLLSMNTLSTKENHSATILFTIEVGELGILSKLLHRISQLPNVLNVFRKRDV